MGFEAPTYYFEGSDGKRYKAKGTGEVEGLMRAAAEEGVTLKRTETVTEDEPTEQKWWSWENIGEGAKGLWDDPTGEHGALAYMGLNMAKGIGTAAGVVGKGLLKGAPDVGFGLVRGAARGVEKLVGADGHAVSGFLKEWHDEYNEIVDAIMPGDQFAKYGMYEGIEGAQETMGAVNSFAESVFAMKGMGLAAKGGSALAGGAKGVKAAQAARIGQAVVAAGMGGKGYAEMAEDPDGPGGWRQELAALTKGGVEATLFGVLGPWKKMNMALPKPFEQLTRTEIVKRFTLEAMRSGAMMAGVEATKEGVEALATAGTDQRWNPKTFGEAAKSVMSQFLVGSAFHAVNAMGKTGAWLAWRSDRAKGAGAMSFQVEQNRKIYAPRLNEQAVLALRAREAGAQWLESGMEGTENVKRVLPNGAVQFDDGSVWQMGKDGRARITVADGTILDARTGAVEGYRANREAAAPEAKEDIGEAGFSQQSGAENAAIMLDALERGELPTVAEPLEGLQITETSYKKGTVLDGEWDQAKAPPVIVWVGNDGTRVLVTGRSRAAAAAAAGVKEIKAVEVREDQGWSRQQAESLDAVENMREGRGTREEIARGVEALGIKSEEDCDRYGIVAERPVQDAITVANEGSEALRGAASEGKVGQAWAAECAGRLGKRALGSAAEKAQATALDMIAGKLPPEEATAAMDALAELAARKPDYTEREAAEAIRAARERAVGRVAVDADSEMVEMPDGSIKSVAEAKAEGSAQAQEEAAQAKEEGNAGNRPESAPLQGARDRAAEPEVKKDGTVGCARFPEATARRVTGEDGRPVVVVEGITGEEMMRPENRDSAVQFITRLKEMAGEADIQFADVSATDAAEALLMAARVKARAEEVRGGGQQSPQQELVEAGQRMVDGLFGEKSGIRVRTGTPEEAEAALRAAGETKPIKDAEGQVQGYYDRAKGEVVLFEGADAGTLAHEIGWHAVWHWAETNSPELLLKMKRYAARAPLKIKALIKEAYGDFTGEALMDEIGAGRFERVLGERFQRLLAKSPEVRTWWRKVLHALARAWKGLARTVGGNRIDLKKLEKMAPEEAIEKLAEQMLEGRRLGEGFAAGEGKRASIAGEGAARNAARREAMTPEERAATPPWATEDVPADRQIIRYSRSIVPSPLGDGKQKYYEVPFDKAVDKIVAKGKAIGKGGVFVTATPDVFAKIGFTRLPIMMTQNHILSISSSAKTMAALGIKGHPHDMKDVLKQVPGALQKPLMIIASETKADESVVAITQLTDKNGKSVIVPVAIGGTSKVGGGMKIDAHIMTSAYGRGNAWSKLVKNALDAEAQGKVGVFYIDNAKASVIWNQLASAVKSGASGGTGQQSPRASSSLPPTVLQLPIGKSFSTDFVHSISDPGSPVNTAGMVRQTETRQFKEFFGDAKKDPANASKVVDAKGEPLVVYRGAPFDPLAQEAGKGVIMPEAYFTADPEYAKRYGKVEAYYLNIRRPFDIRDPECLKDLQSIYPDHEFVRGKSGALDWGEASIVDGEFLRENFGDKYDGIVYDEGGDPTGSGVKYRGVSYVPLEGGAQVKSATDNIGTFDPGNPDVRYSRKGKRRDEVYDDVLKAVRAGSVRVAAGKSERTEAGFDAGAALWMEREGQLGKSQDGSMTLSYSEALRLYRAMSASAHMPKVLERMPHLATRDRKGRLRLNAAAFGIVDKSDLESVKAGLKKDGMFLHEDPSWRLHNDFEEVRAMKEMSEQALAEEMEKLAEARITGKMSGGGRTAVNILAKEIGRIACELPVTAGAPQSLKDLRKLGLGIAKELGDPKGELGKEAREAARWWREQDPARKDPTATKSEDIAESELWAEMFGMFLADPMALQERAPKVYGKMVEAIAGNEKLSEAWNALRRTRDAEGPHERVMRDIERQWEVNAQQTNKELLSELDKPIGKWGKRTKARLLLELHSMEGPAVYWVTDAVRERLAELKRLKKAGKIDDKTYDELAGRAKDEIQKINVALLEKQRGGGKGRRYALEFVERIMGEVEKDGMNLEDLRRYMYAKSVRDGLHQKGKAAALGIDQREAQKVLEELEGRLGADGWAKLETAAKRFQALREQNVLDNNFVLEAFGKDLVNYWKMNASYVRSERTWTAEEVAAYEAARKDWMARHPGESTVIAEIEALMDMHVAKGSGTAGSSFLKPLAGSLKAVKDPIAATLENDLRIIEFAQRNHWACQLAESAKTLGMEGFAVMEDRGGGGKLRGSNRYGSVTFLKDGKRMTLVMPKVVAEGFENAPKSVNFLVKLNRGLSAILTQYSPRFALRNIWRNRASNANNIAWMGEGKFVTAAGLVGMRPVARLATFLMERAAAHLPDRFARNAFMNLLYGSKTNVYWEGEATRIAKIMTDPIAMRERAERAERLASQGKTGEAQRIWEDIEKAKAAMGLPIFAGIRENMWGEADKTDLDAVFRSMGMDTNFDGKNLTKMQLVKRKMKDSAEKVKRFNDFEEARVKLIALLAAEHESMRLENKGENWGKSRDEITYQVATMSGSPRYENRGRVMNYIESALGPFMNVGMKGAWRTIEAMRYDPKRWWTKAAGRIAGRLATCVLWMGGGYKVVADWLRGDAGDDEEKKKRVDAFERFGKRMAHALANVSDYRLRNYDIVPVGLYGKWSTLAISMPRGDEDKLIMPAVDWLVNGLLGSEKAQEMGFALPTDLNYTGSQAVQSTVFGSGIIPDPLRRGLIWTVAQDAIMPWVGYNPYNSYTQRSVYNQDDVDARWEEPWNMAKKVGKQVWNDVGGQVVMPATTWDEDEGAYDDQGQWALSGAEEGEAGCMPIGGKTIFHALHSIPFLSAAASGLITFQNGGNERIARRLEKYRRDDSAPLRAAAQRVADEVIEAVRANGEDFDYSEILAARVSELGLPEEDAEIIEGLAFKKVQGIAAKMGSEFDPIGKTLRKMSTDEKLYRRALRQVEAEGWDGDFD